MRLTPRLIVTTLGLLIASLPPLFRAQVRMPSPVTTSLTIDPTPELSPQAAYDQAVLPVEIVHRSVANWSDAETASLAVAIQRAKATCDARPVARYSGADLLGLARLCALGQAWPAVLEASDRFLAEFSANPPAPATSLTSGAASPRAHALTYKIQAALNLRDPATALSAANLLLTSEPYTALTQQSTEGLLRYVQLIQTADAVNLAGDRQSKILPLLQASAPASPARSSGALTVTAASPASPDALTAHELYAAALALPTLLQLGNNTLAASQVMTSIEAAVPTNLPPDEAALIAVSRRQYALLGSTLPVIAAAVSLFSPSETPRINRNFGAATVLLVFPDWCAQGVRLGSQFLPLLTRHVGEDVHLYGLLAQAQPPPVAAPPVAPTSRRAHPAPAAEPLAPRTAADLLRGTPTLVVAVDLPATAFAATDFPLLVVTDHDGRVRFAQVAPENAFVAGGLVDQVLARVTELWPPPAHP